MSHKREMALQDHIYQPGEYFNKRHQKNKKNGQSEEKAPEANEEFLLVDNAGNAPNNVGTTKRKAAKRKQNFDASSSTAKKQKKWSWSAELVEKLLIYVKEYKRNASLTESTSKPICRAFTRRFVRAWQQKTHVSLVHKP